MSELQLHDWHAPLGARFTGIDGWEAAADYGDPVAEHAALRARVVLLDLSFRGRVCVLGKDRERLLNGQATNHIKKLLPWEGCYAAFLTPKGRLQADANVYRLAEEFLLDGEPGRSVALIQRLEKYVIADDVQIIDAAPHYGLLSLQGPASAAALQRWGVFPELPAKPMQVRSLKHETWGELYLARLGRAGTDGFDLYAPVDALEPVAVALLAAVAAEQGRLAGWTALEWARIEAGIPRFGADMDETTLPPEAGIEDRAISYTKGCYVGQETISRLRTYGRVARRLRGLKFAANAPLPRPGDGLIFGGKEVGRVTSSMVSPALQAGLALGYVRREVPDDAPGLTIRTASGEVAATLSPLPFVRA